MCFLESEAREAQGWVNWPHWNIREKWGKRRGRGENGRREKHWVLALGGLGEDGTRVTNGKLWGLLVVYSFSLASSTRVRPVLT